MDKNAIKKYAVWARRELIEKVSQKALQYGIEEGQELDTKLESINGVLFSDVEKKQRQALINKINEDGYAQVMEEVAYTWFNRFIALRFMEVNGYLPSHVRVFSDESGSFKPQIMTEALHLDIPGLDIQRIMEYKDAAKDEELFEYLLKMQCNALSDILPRIFQKLEDYTELLLPNYLLREGSAIEALVNWIPEDDFNVKSGNGQVEIVGWLYQYYITEQNELVYDGSFSKSKITKELVPAATTIYTPDWSVHYMVENSLGKLWLEGHPNDALKQNWKYYLEENAQDVEIESCLEKMRKEYAGITPEDIKCIDPCMGSGHILCVLFDCLVQIYEDYGYSARESVSSIVKNNIWGLDIDDRAAQLSYFAIMMKARGYDRRFFEKKIQPNVYGIKESNCVNESIVENIHEEKETARQVIRQLIDAKEYGSILTPTIPIEDLISLKEELNKIIETSENGNLIDMMVADELSNTLLPLVNEMVALVQKYHVVVTNPPYLGNSRFSAKLDKYVKKNYLDVKSDLSMVMYKRALTNFVKPNGFVAFITTNSWMVLSRFEKLREYVLNNFSFDSIVDYGTELFEGKVGHNPIVSWVNRASQMDKRITAIRLVDYCYGRRDEKEPQFFNLNNRYYPKQSGFTNIPGLPITYSFSEKIIDAFSKDPSVSDKATTRLGMTTADNNRFVRLWFEVDIEKCIFNAHSDEEVLNKSKKWVPYNKGGKYRKWYGNHDCVVNWYNSGYEIKNFADDKGHIRSTVPNTEFYFLPCATWSKISSGSIAFRYRDYGSIFDVAGACLYADKGLYSLMGFLNSNVADSILSVLSPTLNYEGSHIASLPIDERMLSDERIEALVKENIEISKADWDSFEFSWNFKTHPLIKKGLIEDAFEKWAEECDQRFYKLKENEEEINRIFISMYGIEGEVEAEVKDKNVTVSRADRERDVKSLISYAVGCMFGRYSLDYDGICFAGGAWDDSKYSTFIPDDDSIIPICDDEYFEDDIVGRFVSFIKVAYGEEYLEDNLKFIADSLKGKGTPREIIRNYFLNEFYADHCNACSFGISGKRPIYWMFDSGKKNGFKCLVYLHCYKPDTVARIRTDYIHEQQARYRTAIEELSNRMLSASDSEKVKISKRLTALKEQDDELHKYEEKVHHIADQMIEINLDDGVKHNYEIFKDILAKIK